MGKYIFGPVLSRRLGISLGVDLVPAKTCTMDCVYCEAGKTTDLTLERAEYVVTADVIDELGAFLSSLPRLDYVTFSGAGEPTLHSGIGRIVSFLKTKYPQYKICLITNGSLLGEAGIQKELAEVDLIIPSLDAATDDLYKKINRPAAGLTCGQLIESLSSFRKSFKGTMWLELFVIPGLNDSMDSILALRKAVEKIGPDKVQLNSLDRPGTDEWVKAAVQRDFELFKKEIGEVAVVEIIGKIKASDKRIGTDNLSGDESEKAIVELVRRRPCTILEISSALKVPEPELEKILGKMVSDRAIISENMPRGMFYRIFSK